MALPIFSGRPGPMTRKARNQRAYRARHRANILFVGSVPMDAPIVEALLAAGLVSESESRNRQSVAKAARAVLLEWARRWLDK
jgi:hypothetical protein